MPSNVESEVEKMTESLRAIIGSLEADRRNIEDKISHFQKTLEMLTGESMPITTYERPVKEPRKQKATFLASPLMERAEVERIVNGSDKFVDLVALSMSFSHYLAARGHKVTVVNNHPYAQVCAQALKSVGGSSLPLFEFRDGYLSSLDMGPWSKEERRRIDGFVTSVKDPVWIAALGSALMQGLGESWMWSLDSKKKLKVNLDLTLEELIESKHKMIAQASISGNPFEVFDGTAEDYLLKNDVSGSVVYIDVPNFKPEPVLDFVASVITQQEYHSPTPDDVLSEVVKLTKLALPVAHRVVVVAQAGDYPPPFEVGSKLKAEFGKVDVFTWSRPKRAIGRGRPKILLEYYNIIQGGPVKTE